METEKRGKNKMRLILAVLITLSGCSAWDDMSSQRRGEIIQTGIYIGMRIAEVIIANGQPKLRYSARDGSGQEYLVYPGKVLVFEDGALIRIDEKGN